MRRGSSLPVSDHKLNLVELEQEKELHLDDLDVALFLMLKLTDLYDRLEAVKKIVLLRILAKRIMVNSEGEITGPELNAPFRYLKSLADDFFNNNLSECGSSFVQLGPLHRPPGMGVFSFSTPLGGGSVIKPCY